MWLKTIYRNCQKLQENVDLLDDVAKAAGLHIKTENTKTTVFDKETMTRQWMECKYRT